MRRILFIIAFLCAAQSWATVTSAVSTCSTTNTSSYTSGSFTPVANDFLVAFVTSSGMKDIPSFSDTQSLGFTMVAFYWKGTNADSMYVFVANALAANSSMTVNVSYPNNATGNCIQVLRVTGITRLGPDAVRQLAPISNQAAGTPAVTFPRAPITGNVMLGAVANATNPAAVTAPTSWTRANDTGYNTPTTGADVYYIVSGFTSTTVTWGGASATAFGASALELDTTSAGAASTPALIHFTKGSNILDTGTVQAPDGQYRVPLAEKTTADNTLIVPFTTNYFGSYTGQYYVTDDKNDVFTQQAIYTDNVTDNQEMYVFCAEHVAPNVSVVNITNSHRANTSNSRMGGDVFEVKNTSCKLLASSGNKGTSTSVTAGSMTPGTSGGFLVQYTFRDASTLVPATSWTVGSQSNITWLFNDADLWDGSSDQSGVYNSTSAINPTLTMAPSGDFITIAADFAPNTSGGDGPSSGVRCNRLLRYEQPGTISTTQTLVFPSKGKFLALSQIASANPPNYKITAISDSTGDTWHSTGTPALSTNSPATITSQINYDYNATASETRVLTLTYASTGASTDAGTVFLYDCDGVATATDPLDQYVPNGGNFSTDSGLDTNTITPTTSTGLMLHVGGVGFNTVGSFGNAALTFDVQTSTGEPHDGPQNLNQNNAWGRYYYPNTSAITWHWNQLYPGFSDPFGPWSAAAATFKTPSGGVTMVQRRR